MVKIAVLGPKGSFSERAAKQCGFSDDDIVYCPDLYAVFKCVALSVIPRGIIPIENPKGTMVVENIDWIEAFDLRILQEVQIPVKLCLAGVGRREEVQVILSQSRALDACRRYLSENYPNAIKLTVGSTSEAAMKALPEPHAAAVTSSETARMYGLRIIDDDIQDDPENSTRFVIIGKEMESRKADRNKTSMFVYLDKDRPGALYSILEEFARRKINLAALASKRPIAELRDKYDYVFYIECDGHQEDADMRRALEALKSKGFTVKVLGSYPRTT